MTSPRLSALAALGAMTVLLSGCVGDESIAVGVDSLTIAVPGTTTPDQQAFVDRMTELSEGSISLDVSENWSGGETGIVQAVASGEADIAWATVRSLTELGIEGVNSIEAPLLIRTHDQQRAAALGVPGELIMKATRDTDVVGLALLPGPNGYPIASGGALLSVADWAGKTVQVSSLNPIEAATIEALGATPSTDGQGGVADVVSGAVQAATTDPRDLVAAGVGKDGPYLASNVVLWPRMYIILMNRETFDTLSSRQHGFLDGSVVRAQDTAMADPDLPAVATEACKEGARYGVASADDLTALTEALQPVYASLSSDPAESRLYAAVEDAVKRNAGTGSFSVSKSCRWTPKD
ncbi:MAG: hypothetical protein KF727_13115 [Microbacteriaceae bacterium]|nr:hypothetical protein [Microbacteriaceae bacterium]